MVLQQMQRPCAGLQKDRDLQGALDIHHLLAALQAEEHLL